jgi:hypothetical protein
MNIEIYFSFIVALILLIWFRTEAFVEYCRIMNMNYISKYKDYDLKRKEDVSLTYLTYLRQYHDGFLVRLITCPICLSVWISILLCFMFFQAAIPIVIIGSLIVYGIIDRLLG